MNLWQPKRRIEETYSRAIQEITKYMQSQISASTDPFDMVKLLKLLFKSEQLNHYCEAAAMKMVTQLFADGGQTWRDAARRNSRGRTIYEALLFEMEKPTGLAVIEQIRRNAEIIKTLPISISRQITEHVKNETLKGRRASEIAFDIQEMFPSSTKAKARLIARTEVSKTQTALTQARAEEIGLEWYVWRTSEDARVRSSHEHMEGVLIKWNNPPSPEKLIGERSVGNYQAGCIFNCRCYPQPLISLEDVTWPHKVYYAGSIKSMTRSQFAQLNGSLPNIEEPKTEPKPESQAAPKPEPKTEAVKRSFTPAAHIKEAETYSRDNLKIPNVNLSDFDITAANDINKHFSKLQESFPEVFVMKKLSSCQTMYKDVYEKEHAYRIEEYVKMGYNRSRAEELATKYTKKRKLKPNTVALSNPNKNEFNGISFNQKYYKTAKGYEELKEISKQQADIGFWSHGGVNGTITHEFGHQVMDYLEANSMDNFILETFNKFKQEVLTAKTGLQGYRDLLSEYASTNMHEFFAEAFREYMESINPRKYAKLIGEMTENAFKILRGRR